MLLQASEDNGKEKICEKEGISEGENMQSVKASELLQCQQDLANIFVFFLHFSCCLSLPSLSELLFDLAWIPLSCYDQSLEMEMAFSLPLS